MGMTITAKDALRYMLTPQIGLRLRAFGNAGFGKIAYLIALIYQAVKILPSNHILLQSGRREHLGIREVMVAAAAELKWSKDNIDKIFIYITIMAGLAMLAIQFFLTLAFLMINPALASPPDSYGDFFATPQYNTDVAYRMLYAVFGVPEIFNPGGNISDFHTALHSLFQFYSIGMLVIAVIIVCYYIFAVLAETAQTGVPFGKRYNHVWTPVRLVVALGLLIPMGYGLNAAQWITLYTAKYGSDFATQGWIKFNSVMTDAYLNNPDERVGKPQPPEIMPLAAFMMTVNACKFAYESFYRGDNPIKIDAYLVKETASGGSAMTMLPYRSHVPGAGFDRALSYFSNGNIFIRFGEYKPETHTEYRGYVYPYCGDIIINTADTVEPGARSIQEFYYSLIYDMFTGREYGLREPAENIFKRNINFPSIGDPNAPEPPADFKSSTAAAIYTDLTEAIEQATEEQASSPSWTKDAALVRELGWGGAGLWYNKIAQINGSLVTGVNNKPQIRAMPAALEYIRVQQLQENMGSIDPSIVGTASDQQVQHTSDTEQRIAQGLAAVHGYWSEGDLRQDGLGNQTAATGNFLIDTINLIFGTRGLFDMCANTKVHPLAQLSILGKGLIEASIRNLGLSIAASLGGAFPIPIVGAALSAASSILLSVAGITITMGFMLFYVLPFMPFLYFFFAVGGWIKGLFEAMVGLPLWALAHLRIDGEGLPGDAAMDGYHLILEIFIRPILIVFGLLASVIIFAAMVKILNEIFALVVVNLSGHDPNATHVCGNSAGGNPSAGGPAPGTIAYMRGPVDELFFTVMYAIIVYMIGMSCFKLIDLVPNNLLRYMGARVSTYNDTAGDPTEGLMISLSGATGIVSNKVMGIVGNATGVFGGVAGFAASQVKDKEQ